MNTEAYIQQFFFGACTTKGFLLRGAYHETLLEEKLFSSEMSRFSPEDHFQIISKVLERAMLNPDKRKSERAAQLLNAVSVLKRTYGVFYIDLTTQGAENLLRWANLIEIKSARKLPA